MNNATFITSEGHHLSKGDCNMNITTLPATGFVRLKTVLSHVPMSKSHWYALMAAGLVPKGRCGIL